MDGSAGAGMSQTMLPQGIEPGDYESIEAAVAETVRGRWFLDEYARRCRAAEIGGVLEAIGRLEKSVAQRPTQSALGERLLLQRVGEVAEHLRLLASDLQAHDLPFELSARLDGAVRAVQALAPPSAGEIGAPVPALASPAPVRGGVDPSALAVWDALPLAEKLALFV